MLADHPIIKYILTAFGLLTIALAVYQIGAFLDDGRKLDQEWYSDDKVWNRDLIQASDAAKVKREELHRLLMEVKIRLEETEARQQRILTILNSLQYQLGNHEGKHH